MCVSAVQGRRQEHVPELSTGVEFLDQFFEFRRFFMARCSCAELMVNNFPQ